MHIKRLDHINICTPNLEPMVAFYRDVLDLEPGARPGFPVAGSWHYCDGIPVVHLVDIKDQQTDTPGPLEHFAVKGSDLAGFLGKLKTHGVEYTITIVPDFGWPSVNIYDPDGNHIEVLFDAEEAGAVG